MTADRTAQIEALDRAAVRMERGSFDGPDNEDAATLRALADELRRGQSVGIDAPLRAAIYRSMDRDFVRKGDLTPPTGADDGEK